MKSLRLFPVMLAFFAMGFVDLVGIASNYVQSDLSLSDATANTLPGLVFFWFLIFSVPTGLLMNRIGRKRTVLLSLIITAASLVLPLAGETFPVMLAAFSLLGIGNAVMQTSLNPLLATLVGGGQLASSLTFGQFVKAIASFLAPYIAAWGATAAIPSFGLGWRVLFPVYAIVAVAATLCLAATPIKEEQQTGDAAGFRACLALLGKPFIVLCFFGIMCHVGIDVGVNTTAPRLLMERAGQTLAEAGFATSLYFIFRTIGCLAGSAILARVSPKLFAAVSVVLMAASAALMFAGSTATTLYIAMALVGLGNSNIFSVVFSQALLAEPQNKNEVSGLMIMGLFGGTLFPILMGLASSAAGAQWGAVVVIAVGILYLAYYTLKIRK